MGKKKGKAKGASSPPADVAALQAAGAAGAAGGASPERDSSESRRGQSGSPPRTPSPGRLTRCSDQLGTSLTTGSPRGDDDDAHYFAREVSNRYGAAAEASDFAANASPRSRDLLLPCQLPLPRHSHREHHAMEGDAEHAQRYIVVSDVLEDGGWAGWGHAPPGTDRAAAFRWARAALLAVEAGDARFKPALKALLSSTRLYHDQHSKREGEFQQIRALAQGRLANIGRAEEHAWRQSGPPPELVDLGELGEARVPAGQRHPRQHAAGLLPPVPRRSSQHQGRHADAAPGLDPVTPQQAAPTPSSEAAPSFLAASDLGASAQSIAMEPEAQERADRAAEEILRQKLTEKGPCELGKLGDCVEWKRKCTQLGFRCKLSAFIEARPAIFALSPPPGCVVSLVGLQQQPSGPPERRVAPDGRRYTKAEFLEHFKGLREWEAAAPKIPNAPEERRLHQSTGSMLTRTEFVTRYGVVEGRKKWESAPTRNSRQAKLAAKPPAAAPAAAAPVPVPINSDWQWLYQPVVDPEGRLQPQVEDVYDFVLLLAAAAINPVFEAAVGGVLGDSGHFRCAPIKSRQRLNTKRRTDHVKAPSPKCAENLDVCRAACAFDTPADLRYGLQAVRDTPQFGKPLRIKNGYAEDGSSEENGWYRAVLCNYVFEPGCTWGHICGTAECQQAWTNLWHASTSKMSGDLCEDFRRYYDLARQFWSRESVLASKASIVVEVQYMLTRYLDMRKKTHLWYKVARAVNGRELCVDFRSG